MKSYFNNNGQYCIKQKIQRTLKNTCKILLTLSLSYAISTKFIPVSFAVITEENIRNMYVNPEVINIDSQEYVGSRADLEREIKMGPFISTMRALLPENAQELRKDDALKALLKCVMGGFMVDPHAADQQEKVAAAIKKTYPGYYDDGDILRKAVETIATDYIKRHELQLSDELFSGDARSQNNLGTYRYTERETLNYLITTAHDFAVAEDLTIKFPKELYERSIPIDLDRTKDMVSKIKEELDPVIAKWATNTHLLKQLQKESDNKYATRDEQNEHGRTLESQNQRLTKDDIIESDGTLDTDMTDSLRRDRRGIHRPYNQPVIPNLVYYQALPKDSNKSKDKISNNTSDTLKEDKKISSLNLTKAELKVVENSSRVTEGAKQTEVINAAETAITTKKDAAVLEAGTAITQQQNAATTLIGNKQTEAMNAIEDKKKTVLSAAATAITAKKDEAVTSIGAKQTEVINAAETAITAKKDAAVLDAGTAITQKQDAATTLIGTKQTEAMNAIEDKKKDAVAAAETAIIEKKNTAVLDAGNAIAQQQNAATTLIGNKQTEAMNAIEDKKKTVLSAAATAITAKKDEAVTSIGAKQTEVINAAETAITAKKDAAVLDAGTAIAQQQNAATTLIGTKQTEAINSIDAKKQEVVSAAETAIVAKKEEVVKAIDDKRKEAIESTEDAIQIQKDKATWELMSLEAKKMQISEAQAQELKGEQEKLEERIVKLEQKLNTVSNDERQLSEQEVQELRAQCEALKQELKNLQERLNEVDQEERQTSEAEVKQLKEEHGKLANELQKVKNERIAEAQKSQEEQKLKEEQKSKEEQKIIEEKIAQEVKQKEELEDTNNKVARSQDVASNAATSIKSMEMLSHAVNLAVSQLVGDRISNIIQIDNGEEKDLVAQVSKRKIVASGSQVAHANEVQASLRPKSWDIWGSAHIGTVSQSAINNYGATSKTGLHGFVLGIDKMFGYNILGFAISYGQSHTRYAVPQLTTSSFTKSYNHSHHVNAEQKNSYYQASMYVRYSPDDRFFVQLLGGLGTYAQNARINNLFFNSDPNSTSGHSVNATIGYHYYSSEKLVLTPTLGIFYNYLNIPGQSNINNTSSSNRHTIINKIDAMIGLNVKLISTGNMMNNNVRIIPEVTAAIKFRIHEAHEEKTQVPVALMLSLDNLSSNITAAPRQLMQVGAKLTIGNDTVLFGIYGYADVAIKYHALTCGINLKLYL